MKDLEQWLNSIKEKKDYPNWEYKKEQNTMDYELNEIENYNGYLEMVREQLKDMGYDSETISDMELKVEHYGKGATSKDAIYWEQYYMQYKNEGRVRVMDFNDYMKIVNRNKKLEQLLNEITQ